MTTEAPVPALAARLTLWWVRFYTAGLPAAGRARRAGEVESDLWEHHADRLGDGLRPVSIGLEVLGRAVRGAPADLLWRFQLEGPKVQIHIPIERVAGACLLALVAGAMLSLNVAGYDPAREGFEEDLDRLAGIPGRAVMIYTVLQVLSGLGMLGGAAVLCLALRRYSMNLAVLAAVALACAGVLTLVTSAIYVTAADLADEWAAAGPGQKDSVLTVARAFVVTMSALMPVTVVALAVGVYGFAIIMARYHRAPRWLRYVAGGSVVSLAAAIAIEVASAPPGAWVFFVLGMVLLLAWLLVAGGALLFGDGWSEPHASEPAPRPA